MDGVSCHEFGPVDQTVRPSHLDHFTLRGGSELSTVSTLKQKHPFQSQEHDG